MDQDTHHSQVILMSVGLRFGRIDAMFMVHMLVGSVSIQNSVYHGTNLLIMTSVTANRFMFMLSIVVAVAMAVAMTMAMAMMMFCMTCQHVLGLKHRKPNLPCRNKMLIILRQNPIAPMISTNFGCSTPISSARIRPCCNRQTHGRKQTLQ